MTTTYRAQADGIPVIDKSPSAILDYPFDWRTDGWLATGENIASNTVTVASGLTNSLTTATNDAVTAWLSGGVAGTSYLVSCRITTTAVPPRTDERSIRVNVIKR